MSLYPEKTNDPTDTTPRRYPSVCQQCGSRRMQQVAAHGLRQCEDCQHFVDAPGANLEPAEV